MKRSVSFTLVVLLLAACSNRPQDLAWTRIDLPADGAVVLSDVADCDGHWWAAGGIKAADGSTRPAAWSDGAAVTFTPLPSSYYGPRQVIKSVACAGGRVAMVGATPGGAHGNPRVSTWRFEGGRMAENAAPFETYGGDEAIDVGPIAAGPAGFAIAGNRTSGAAAWFSPDGKTFTLSESGTAGTVARDVVPLADGRWLVVGGAATGAAAWIAGPGGWSPDGKVAVDTSDLTELQRAVRDGDDVVAAGLGKVWRRHNGAWTVTGAFVGGSDVRDLAVADGQSVVVAERLWIGDERRSTPAEPVAVAARGTTVLLATDDSLWQTTVHR
ncbi:hypothetical protein OWR29_06455 [Actinoplanes sp. Pm04-4]|uniref:Uncharacterized protein n=1 Tax=Paractinoplanes pyxinae TaxID=2997416 RepID=A0ABT4ATR8_9ACTN|nr:hypothetical protein [Actinoplanes pyxinae]MCY1137636.1 hypothetical protein [Actinoplanes pyxinae]